ncbi:hypothetical protein HDU82_004095 [Entophlyctis luteolus]|nr:hypothetical protein HDU82_004095 [Entophlyctis luteolus]
MQLDSALTSPGNQAAQSPSDAVRSPVSVSASFTAGDGDDPVAGQEVGLKPARVRRDHKKRLEQNRAAQRAFRSRQMSKQKELEQKVEDLSSQLLALRSVQGADSAAATCSNCVITEAHLRRLQAENNDLRAENEALKDQLAKRLGSYSGSPSSSINAKSSPSGTQIDLGDVRRREFIPALELFGPPIVEPFERAFQELKSMANAPCLRELFRVYVRIQECADPQEYLRLTLKLTALRHEILDLSSILDRRRVVEIWDQVRIENIRHSEYFYTRLEYAMKTKQFTDARQNNLSPRQHEVLAHLRPFRDIVRAIPSLCNQGDLIDELCVEFSTMCTELDQQERSYYNIVLLQGKLQAACDNQDDRTDKCMDISSLVLRPSPPALPPHMPLVKKSMADGDEWQDGDHSSNRRMHVRPVDAMQITADPSSASSTTSDPVSVPPALPLVYRMPPPPPPHFRLPIHRFPNLLKPQMPPCRPPTSWSSVLRLQPQKLPTRDPTKLARNRDAQRAFRLRQAQRITQNQLAVVGLTCDVRERLLVLQRRIDSLAEAAADVRQAIDAVDCNTRTATVTCSGGEADAWICAECAGDVITPMETADAENEQKLEKCRNSLEVLPSLVGTNLVLRYLEIGSKLSKCTETREFKDCLIQLVAVREELLDECSATDWKRALEILEDLNEAQAASAAAAHIHRAVCDLSKSIDVNNLKTRAPLVPGFLLKGQLTQALMRIPPLASIPEKVENLCDRCWDYFYASDSDGSALFAMCAVFQEVYGLCTQKEERIQLARATDSARQFSKKGKSRFFALQKII